MGQIPAAILFLQIQFTQKLKMPLESLPN